MLIAGRPLVANAEFQVFGFAAETTFPDTLLKLSYPSDDALWGEQQFEAAWQGEDVKLKVEDL